ncbi:MAG: FAD-binding oxidoreductase [Desulfobacterales bacterium]|nr:MAG: FAD-binding oxidoreductase [Desulfobacterales bacterium]
MHEISTQLVALADYEKIRRVEGFKHISSEYPTYLTDESKLSPEPFDYLFFPMDEAELAAIFKQMSERKQKVTIAGARTGLVGGCVPRKGALVSLENFDRINTLYYDGNADEWRIRCQCAVNLRSLQAQITSRNFPDLQRCGDQAVLNALSRFKEDPANYFYPPDPTEMSASIGGTVATNASGARTFRYGPTRDWVRGIRVLLPNGEILSIPRGKYFASPAGEFTVFDSKGNDLRIKLPSYRMPRTKNTAGFFTEPQMDLIDLFIGSEGCFGVITEVTVALLKRTEKISMIQFLNSDEQAIDLVNALRNEKRVQLDFLEFYSGNALDLLRQRQLQDPKSVDMPIIPDQAGAALFFEFSFDSMADSLDYTALEETLKDCGASLSDSWAAYENRELQRLKDFRHILPETINTIIAERKKQYPELHKLGTDLAVPDERLQDMWQIYTDTLDTADLQWVAFGHIGNNHIHINILPRNVSELQKGLELYQKFAAKAVEFGGTVSAEHGIGKMKIKFLELMYSPDQINEMRAVKSALDPESLLNPGNLFCD